MKTVERITCLDGMRGLAALWVLVGHTMLLTGYRVPILSQPELGVDLFILLSGYLMVFQYQIRRTREDWSKFPAWTSFWIRRFFRLSPLYFLLLFVALIAGDALYSDRSFIDQSLGRTPQLEERYNDLSATNVLMHLSYLYGIFPEYAFRTPLPDWSLSLEMQFYAVFPLLVLACEKAGWLRTAIITAIGCFGAVVLMKWLGVGFPMPSFLPLKMHIFLAGMLVAVSQGRRRYLMAALVLAVFPYGGAVSFLHLASRELLVLGFFLIVTAQGSRIVALISSFLSSRPLYWTGELSYGSYLVHLLVLHPVASFAISIWGSTQAPIARFFFVLPIVLIITYLLSAALFFSVEKPGQDLGRVVLRWMGRREGARQTEAERIDAP